MKTSKVVRVSVIAALYAVVTVVFAPLSYGLHRYVFRSAYCITLYLSESVMGLFLGCFIAIYIRRAGDY